ncbi:PilZ domain-containing protein [Sphingomonas radiodurans]|uniref:PilZ domain-containing protein n=1 Tax=Sphingomonas radiodurans TaxID=2890321 RepID=UPI001E63A1D3|nr:PilZ domain-containing protein [Sphingomonas radiodurans]WBH16039.1 PilZ domain-containing protein [Sphingomonas radiodurans]
MDSARASVFLDAAPAEGGERGRDSMFLLATLKVEGRREALQVRVRNLSTGGLMAELPEPVSPDSPVEIELRGIGSVTGRVAWQTEGRAGIAFDRPIDPQRARKPVGGRKDDDGPRPLRFPR